MVWEAATLAFIKDCRLRWFIIGWVSILVLKYFVIGLDAWNAALHPGLIVAPNQQPYRKPFLGLFANVGNVGQQG
jgi:hypothetical protein